MLGSGTQASPFIIQTPTDLHAIRNKLIAGTYYELGNDINMASWGNFATIGSITSSQRFNGSFDGKGYRIKNLTIVGSAAYTGLFAVGDNKSSFKNVFLENVNITSAFTNTGALVGVVLGSSGSVPIISNIGVTGNITGLTNVGSITGTSQCTILNCYSTAHIKATNVSSGAVYGMARGDSTLYETIDDCVFDGTLEGFAKYPITNYAGNPMTSNTGLYYNSDKVPTSSDSADGSIRLTTSQFADESNFPLLDKIIWGFGSYPYLKVFGEPSLPSQKVTVTLNSHSDIANQLVQVSKRSVRVNVSHSETFNSVHALELIKHANVMSHIEQIVSNVTAIKNANVKSYVVTSYLDEFGSEVTRVVTTQRLIQSHVNPIDSVIMVEIPIGIEKPVYANVYIVENPTNLQTIENKSNVDSIENKSNMSTYTHQTNTLIKQNATETSVI